MRNALLTLLFIAVSTFVHGQFTVKGRITSGNINLANASVRSTDNKVNITCDSVGRFEFRTSEKEITLLISHIGFNTEKLAVKLPQDLPLTINLSASESQLEDVSVSTGYQLVPKERSTGAFDFIKKETFNQQVSTDVLSRLEAVANGVSFNRTTQSASGLIIRGLSTFSGPKQPLIVVDNFPYEGDLNNLNPNDVENISILKDAAASSIWGTRAGNGVIVITTKKGKLNTALKTEFNTNLTIAGEPDLSYIPQLSSSAYIDIERMLFANKYRFSDTSSTRHLPFSPAYELMFKQLNGKISKTELERQLSALAAVDLRDEYQNATYRKAINQQYALALSGGSTKASWYFSSGYDRNISNLHAVYDRVNLNFQNSYAPAKFVKLNTALRYTQSKSTGGRPSYGSIRMTNQELPPYTRFMDDNGNALSIARTYRQNYIDTVGKGKLLNWNYYMDDYRNNSAVNKISDLVLNVGADLSLAKWLTGELKYQYEKQDANSDFLNGADSYFARNLINQYSQINQAAGTVKYIVPKGGILDQSANQLIAQSFRAQLNFNKAWGKHEATALAGAELRDQSLNGTTNRTFGYDPELITYQNTDLTISYPSIVNGARSFIPDMSGFTGTTNRFVSAFFNGAYTYDGKYVISGSARRDASNLFGVNANDKWNLLWSVGGAWNISRESFYDVEWLSYLKLRATYGFSGNVDLNRSAVTTVQFLNTSPYTLTPIGRFSQFANPELRWEKVRMTNVAIDFATTGNRISGSIDFFWKHSSDLFGPSQMDYTTGTSTTITRNIASLNGKGFDLALNSVNLSGPIKWTSNINFSVYRDEVGAYYKNAVNGSDFLTGASPSVTAVSGKPLYAMYSYRWEGLDPQNGDPVGFINGHKSKNYNAITGDSTKVTDLIYSGSALPTVYGSVGNSVSYKNFSVTLRVLFNLGYYYRRGAVNYSTLFSSNLGGHPELENRWKKPRDEISTNVPSMVYPTSSSRDSFYAGSEATVEKGDHVRLQYINLSYDFTRNALRKLPFQNLRIYANISNLGILWAANKEGIDPEYRLNAVPPPKTFAFGINLTL